MIVCWVLFGLTAVTTAVGWGIKNFSYGQIMSIRDNGAIVDNELKADWGKPLTIENRLRAMQLVNERRIQILDERTGQYAIIGAPVPQGFELDDPDVGKTKSELVSDLDVIKAQLNEVRRYRQRYSAADVTAIVAGLMGLVILLWNIIWHTSHWVWMGRKAE